MRSAALGRWLRRITLVVMGGLVIAVAAYSLTSQPSSEKFLGGPDMTILAYPSWDPWAGSSHGYVIEGTVVDGKGGATRVINESMPRLVIPLPVGFALGALVTIGVRGVRSRKNRSTLEATA